jgi:hypothetical protein
MSPRFHDLFVEEALPRAKSMGSIQTRLNDTNRLLKNTCSSGCSKMSRCKAPETGDPPEGWGVRAFCGQIPKSEAYIEVRRNDEG